jgi:hypothetical protein
VNIFLHVGVPKSGTTILENALFGQHPEIRILAKPYSNGALDFPFRLAIRKSLQCWAMSTRPSQITLNDAQRAWTCKRYDAGNANLSTAIKLPLSEWEYRMSEMAASDAAPAPIDDRS